MKKAAVGNNIEFDTHGCIYILTGPNNGGKTFFLSSVGTAQVLAQLGMLDPERHFEVSPAYYLFVHYPKHLNKAIMGRLEDECVCVKEIFLKVYEYSICLFQIFKHKWFDLSVCLYCIGFELGNGAEQFTSR